MRRDAVELPEAEILAISELQASQPTMMSTQPAAPAITLMSRVVIALLFSTAFVAGSFVWQGRDGFNMGDEGFLWYGVQRVLAGEVPILDFMSYDPGRYYWSAALMRLMHDDGIMAMRGAATVFQLLGLFVGLLLLLRPKSRLDVPLFTLAAITLTAWMFTWYKVYDTSLAIMLVGILTFVVQEPSRLRFFFAGIGIGFLAVFGRNHGVYGIAGILGVTIYLACKQRKLRGLPSALAVCACGVTLGYLPILVMLIAVPGFAAAFWASIRFLFETGATNLPLPVPWPWSIQIARLPIATAAINVLTGVFFVAILTFSVLSLLWVFRQALLKKPLAPAFVASAMLAVPYAHYAFSRADLIHLGLGIFPFLVGIFLLMQDRSRRMRRLLGAAAASATLVVVLPQHPGWNCLMIESCVAMEIGGSTLKVEPLIGKFVTMLNAVVEQHAPNGKNFLVTPLWSGAYALFNVRSPMWEIYALFKRDSEFQLREIERIKAAQPGFVLVLNIPLDGHEDLRFRNTHPLIEQYVRENFDPMTIENFPPPTFQFYKSR
jgi:hypothetical protein